MDVLSRKTLPKETQQDTILSEILERIRKDVRSNSTIAERPFKEAWQKLRLERGIIYNTGAIVPLQILRKGIVKIFSLSSLQLCHINKA